MRRNIARIRGLGFIMWHARHELYHVLLGLVWAWFLREQWNEYNPFWIWLAVFGSLLPDVDHLFFWLGYGKDDAYTQKIFRLLRERRWRELVVFIEQGHKMQTGLSSHNFYMIALLLAGGLFAFLYEWRSGVVLFGAIVIHYFFDVFDDIMMLGGINPNWKRWGREK